MLFLIAWGLTMQQISLVSPSIVSDSLHLIDYRLLGSSVYGIFQARILEWVAIPFSRWSSQLRDRTWVSYIAGRFLTIWAIREALRILEWVAIPFSRGSSPPRDQNWVFCIASRFFTIWATREAQRSLNSWLIRENVFNCILCIFNLSTWI